MDQALVEGIIPGAVADYKAKVSGHLYAIRTFCMDPHNFLSYLEPGAGSDSYAKISCQIRPRC